MVVVNEPSKYKFVRFQKSQTKNKKYDAIIQNKKTKKERRIPFGDNRYQQYKDQTGLGIYKHLDHLDEDRRRNFRSRFAKSSKKKFSSAYFAFHYLW